MQSRGASDLPYWPSQNMYVYKEVWVHSTSRWLWLMEDLLAPKPLPVSGFDVTSTTAKKGTVTIRAVVRDSTVHSLTLRAENLKVERATRTVPQRRMPVTIEWKVRLQDAGAPWAAVIHANGDLRHRLEVK